MRKIILAAMMLAAGTLGASATTISGTYSIASTASTSPTITDIMANPFSFNLLVGTPQTFDLAKIFENAAGSSTITASFSFTSPAVGPGSAVEGDVFTVTGSARHDTLTPGATSIVNFSDGAVLDITFGSAGYNGSADNYTGLVAPVTFALMTAPTATTFNAVPEPLTLSLFGAGLAGAAAMRRRKIKKA